MWSIYDTLVLVTGIIVAVIAVLPVRGIPAATRFWSGAIGGGLILLALFLGSLRAFRYPSLVYGGPVIALLALGGVVADARRRTKPDQAGLPFEHRAGQAGRAPAPVAVPVPVAVTSAPALEVDWLPADGGGASQSDGQREAAWREVHDRGTSAARLAEIAGRYPEFGPAMVDHPQAYPELREWIHRLPGDTGEAGK